MSFQQRWSDALSAKQGRGEECDTLRQAWPTLGDVLLGKQSAGDEPGWPACKVLLFMEAGKLKFMLSPIVGDLVAFGTFQDVTGGFDGLEQELASGRFEWKKRRR